MATVRGFPWRIRYIASKVDVTELGNGINGLLDPYFAAYERIKSSERLRTILWLVLYVGNYVNQGTPRGDALGFSFEYITSLKPLRGNEPDMNMLNYLVGLVTAEFPDLLGIVAELTPVRLARDVRFRDVEEMQRQFDDAIEGTKAIVEAYHKFPLPPNYTDGEHLSPENDRFRQVTAVRHALLDWFPDLYSLTPSTEH